MKASELWRERTKGTEDATSDAVANLIEAVEDVIQSYETGDEMDGYTLKPLAAALTALKEIMED